MPGRFCQGDTLAHGHSNETWSLDREEAPRDHGRPDGSYLGVSTEHGDEVSVQLLTVHLYCLANEPNHVKPDLRGCIFRPPCEL